MRLFIFFIATGFCLFLSSPLLAQSVQYRLFMTGNTADVAPGTGYFTHLHELLASADVPFTLLLNGDFIQDPAPARLSSRDSLRVQKLLRAVSGFENGKTILIPGDRDWADSGPEGWESVKNLEAFIEGQRLPGIEWAIKQACPGPEEIELAPNLLLIVLQTQWWNHPYDKPVPADATCKTAIEEDFLEELEDAIRESRDKNILVAGHFPLLSFGQYGGRNTLKRHLFPFTDLNRNLYLPLPLLGSFYAAFRQNVGTSRDIINAHYEDFRDDLEDILLSNQSLIYLSGHERNIQLIRREENYYLNCGSAGQKDFAGPDRKAMISEAIRGICELVFYENGDVYLEVYRYEEERGFVHYDRRFLYQSSCLLHDTTGSDSLDAEVPFNQTLVACGDNPYDEEEAAVYYDSLVSRAAGPQYAAGGIRQLFLGKHYREVWTTPVMVTYLNMDTTAGGLEMKKVAGGRQTLSVRLQGENRREYNFRSVDKDPRRIINYDLRETVVGFIMRDQTSTQHPYGAAIAAALMDSLSILHPRPALHVLPPHYSLGFYMDNYGHMLGFLEENPKGPGKKQETFAEAAVVHKSYRFFRALYNDHDALVDKNAYARARLFDIWIGDWGRHEDNWKWAGYKLESAGGTYTVYQPIPRDRDHAFSLWDGMLPWLADRRWVRPQGEHFGKKIHDINSLTWSARHLDRLVANQLSLQDWLGAVQDFRALVNDSMIEKALRQMPPEVYPLSAAEMKTKLKARMQGMDKYAERFYRLLAREVDVVGSNEEEYFEVRRHEDGTTEVFMYARAAGKRAPVKENFYYYRRFYPSETKEIRLFGLGGEDVFVVKGKAPRSPLLRIIGGPGQDYIADSSRVRSLRKKTLVYEKEKGGKLQLGAEGKKINNVYSETYNYDRKEFAYNMLYPIPYLLFNRDDGLLLSMGAMYVSQSYGKKPYASQQSLRLTLAFNGSFGIRYRARFRQIWGNWDLEVLGDISNPTRYFYYFGRGNNTVKSDSLFNADYYRSRYNAKNLAAGISREFWKRSRLYFGLRYENNEPQLGANTLIVEEGQDVFGNDRANMISALTILDLDFRDDPNFPTQGMRFFGIATNGLVTNHDYQNYGKTYGFISFFTTLRTRLPLTLGLRGGGAYSYGPIPFYNMPTLGHGRDLRGFFRNRFTGDSHAFFNSELRLQVADLSRVSVPVRFGVKGFYDVGRVFLRGESSRKWHHGYGFGIYIIPYKELLTLTVTAGFSAEETLYLRVSLGVPFR